MHDGSAWGQTRPPLQRLRFVCAVLPCQESGMVLLSVFSWCVSTWTQGRMVKDTTTTSSPAPNFQLPKESRSNNCVKGFDVAMSTAFHTAVRTASRWELGVGS